jgi:hypothetical protein
MMDLKDFDILSVYVYLVYHFICHFPEMILLKINFMEININLMLYLVLIDLEFIKIKLL